MNKIIYLLFCFFVAQVQAQKKELPDFKVKSTKGEVVVLKQKIDKLTLIDYWATWCKPCIAEMPHLENIKKEYGGKIQVISLSVDKTENIWKDYHNELNSRDHHYWTAPKGEAIDLITNYITTKDGSQSSSWYIPRFLLINKDGLILEDDLPPPSTGAMNAIIDKYL